MDQKTFRDFLGIRYIRLSGPGPSPLGRFRLGSGCVVDRRRDGRSDLEVDGSLRTPSDKTAV